MIFTLAVTGDGLADPYPSTTTDVENSYLTEAAFAGDVRSAVVSAFLPAFSGSPTGAGGIPIVTVLQPVTYRVSLSLAVQFPNASAAAAFAGNTAEVALAVAAARALCPDAGALLGVLRGGPLQQAVAVVATGAAATVQIAATPIAPAALAQRVRACLATLTVPDGSGDLPRLLASPLAAQSALLSAAASCFLSAGPTTAALYSVVVDSAAAQLQSADILAAITPQAVASLMPLALAGNYIANGRAELIVRAL